ncbi:MAG: peptidyl-prolyl cis-trans isomerase D [Porticoccaceae bacterium]|jgi:peptidyl-prolyl cis-trans isomerase D|tara:strand:+ start:1741 stop:3594 length:1854 start_codon:yes stop_codon:yes gene_type:complete
MLDSFRTNMKGMAIGITVVIGAIFAFSGTGTLFLSGSGADAALIVNDSTITELQVVRAISSQKQRILNENEGLDASLLDDDLLRPNVVDQLIGRELLAQASQRQRMGVSEQTINDYILASEAFQSDGRFDQNRYRFALQQQGYTSASFKAMLSNDMRVQQLINGITDTVFATDLELSALASVTEQKRDFYYLRLPVAPIQESVVLSDEQISDYYQANLASYQTDAQVVVDYIELSPAQLVDPTLVTSRQIATRFEEELLTLDLAESRQVAHILLEDASDELVAEIQGKIIAGETFGELAREYSDDFASAESEGDLGYTAGDTFPEAFESALAILNLGEVSPPVTTDAGIHFIKLLDIQQDTYLLTDESPRIERELMREATTDQLIAKLELLKELSFNAESLTEVAEDVGLELNTSDAFSRFGGQGVTGIAKVSAAAFSDEVIKDKYASEVLDLGNDRYVVLKLNQYIDVRQKEMSEVRESVVVSLTASESAKRLADLGSELLAEIVAGSSVESVAKARKLEWQVGKSVNRRGIDVNAEVRSIVFNFPLPGAESVIDGFYLSNGDYVVAELTKVVSGDLSSLSQAEIGSLAAATRSMNASRDMLAYQDTLREKAEIVQ